MANTHIPTGHEKIETNNLLMIVLILLVVAVGGIVEISHLLALPGGSPLGAALIHAMDVIEADFAPDRKSVV